MRKLLMAVLALAALTPSAAPAATHPPEVSTGGVVIGTDTICSTQIDAQLFAHDQYFDVNGNVVERNQIVTTATSTCTPYTSSVITPSVNTLVRLYDQHGKEVGSPLSCSNAAVCQRTDWIVGAPGDQFKVAGAAIWRLPAGNASAWFKCIAPTVDGLAQTGWCSLSNDPKWAAISSYAHYYLV